MRKQRLADDNVELAVREVQLPDEKELFLHALSDVHVESPTFRKKAFEAKLTELRRSPKNHRILLLGDMCDAAIASSKGFHHGARTPEDALHDLLAYFKPLADRIDLIMPGNHEARIERVAGLSFTKVLAAQLGRPECFRAGPTLVRYCAKQAPSHKGTNMYKVDAKIFCHHVHGGGARPGSSINRIEDLAKTVPDADVYLMGHTHRRFVNQDAIYCGWPLREHRRTFINTGTYEGHEMYGQEKGLPPLLGEGPPVVRLLEDNRRDMCYRLHVEVLS